MLTDFLHRHFDSTWATQWVRTRLDKRPRLVDLDHESNLVMEYVGTDDVVWSPGQLMKELQQSDPLQATECCYHLCCQYDDHQDTAEALRVGLREHFNIWLESSVFWWDRDLGGVVTTVMAKQRPNRTKGLRVLEHSGEFHLVWLSSACLHGVLSEHLKTRAFPQE